MMKESQDEGMEFKIIIIIIIIIGFIFTGDNINMTDIVHQIIYIFVFWHHTSNSHPQIIF